VVLAQAIRNWWLAYLFGIHSGEITPDSYRQHYSRNVRFPPRSVTIRWFPTFNMS
jgi:hypothetical protein